MEKLEGHELGSSEKIKNLIGQIVQEVQTHSAKIEGPRSPQPDFETSNQKLVDDIGKTRGRPLFYPYVGTGVGRGCYVELEDGSIKMDLINGIGIHILGHSHPLMVESMLTGAVSDIVVQGNLQPNKEYLDIGAELVRLASKNSRLEHAWVTTSGSMANENALKMARQKNTPAKKVIAMRAAFAGRTTLMAEITDNPNNKIGLPDYDDVLRVSFPRNEEEAAATLAEFKEHLDREGIDVAAFIFEPMQGEGGYWTTQKEYLEPILKLCKENSIAVWADEIQTFCRTGEFFAFEKLGIGEYIDLCTVAKTLQNAATLYTAEYNPKPGLIAGTFTGSTPALQAGIKVLQHLDQDGFMGPNGKIEKIHNEFVGMLNRLNDSTCKGLLTDAGGMGLMCSVTPFDGSREKMIELLKVLYKNGLMTFGCGRGPFRLRFLLPAVLTTEDIECAGKIIEKSILEMS